MSKKNWLIAGLAVLVAVLLVAVTALSAILVMKGGGGSGGSGSGKGGASSPGGDAGTERTEENDRGVSRGGRGEASASRRGYMTVALPNSVKMELVKVEAGTFTMGSSPSEAGRYGDEMQHRVTLTKDFHIGKTEVTQAQWKAVMGNNPSYFKGDDLPVEQVSWNDAMEFCKKLNDMGKAPRGWKFTLPTEAQWEYAARGGSRSRGYEYGGSNNVDEVAWNRSNSVSNTHPVAQKKANELGLYDMSGNVWEWCLDWYEEAYAGDPEFLTGNSGSDRVFRGGSWYGDASFCRSAYRRYNVPDDRYYYLGFRVALVPVR